MKCYRQRNCFLVCSAEVCTSVVACLAACAGAVPWQLCKLKLLRICNSQELSPPAASPLGKTLRNWESELWGTWNKNMSIIILPWIYWQIVKKKILSELWASHWRVKGDTWILARACSSNCYLTLIPMKALIAHGSCFTFQKWNACGREEDKIEKKKLSVYLRWAVHTHIFIFVLTSDNFLEERINWVEFYWRVENVEML